MTTDIRKHIDLLLQLAEQDDYEIPTDSKERQTLLKELVDDGVKPEVVDAGFSHNRFSFGDLDSIGYAVRLKQRVYGSNYETWWEYTGPNSVVLVTTIGSTNGSPTTERTEMRVGDETERVEVDYS